MTSRTGQIEKYLQRSSQRPSTHEKQRRFKRNVEDRLEDKLFGYCQDIDKNLKQLQNELADESKLTKDATARNRQRCVAIVPLIALGVGVANAAGLLFESWQMNRTLYSLKDSIKISYDEFSAFRKSANHLETQTRNSIADIWQNLEALNTHVNQSSSLLKTLRDEILKVHEYSVTNRVYLVFLSDFRRTTAYHQSANGLCERLGKTLISIIRKFTEDQQRNWDEFLPYALWSYNTTVQESTGYSPYFLLYGREPVLTIDHIFYGLRDQNAPYFQELARNIEHIRFQARENLRRQQDRQKFRHDQRARVNVRLNIGDYALVKNNTPKPGLSRKLRPKFIGPFKL